MSKTNDPTNSEKPKSSKHVLKFSQIICVKIERFYEIMRRDMVYKILKLEEMLQNQFRLEELMQKSIVNQTELASYFPILPNKQQVRQFQDFYCLGNKQIGGLLYWNGLFPTNIGFNTIINVICKEYERFYHLTQELYLTIELLMPPYLNRNVFEYSFLTTIKENLKQYNRFSLNQHQELCRIVNDKRSYYIHKVALYPQFQDYRFLCQWWETEQTPRTLQQLLEGLLYSYHYLYDLIIKNGDKLSEHLQQSYQTNKKVVLDSKSKKDTPKA